jgi:hypothetical protein
MHPTENARVHRYVQAHGSPLQLGQSLGQALALLRSQWCGNSNIRDNPISLLRCHFPQVTHHRINSTAV